MNTRLLRKIRKRLSWYLDHDRYVLIDHRDKGVHFKGRHFEVFLEILTIMDRATIYIPFVPDLYWVHRRRKNKISTKNIYKKYVK